MLAVTFLTWHGMHSLTQEGGVEKFQTIFSMMEGKKVFNFRSGLIPKGEENFRKKMLK